MNTTIEKELHTIGLYLRDIRDTLEKMRNRDEIRFTTPKMTAPIDEQRLREDYEKMLNSFKLFERYGGGTYMGEYDPRYYMSKIMAEPIEKENKSALNAIYGKKEGEVDDKSMVEGRKSQ